MASRPHRIITAIGEVGAGITRAPLDYFTQAVTALASIPLGG
jgi:hypothetical protein